MYPNVPSFPQPQGQRRPRPLPVTTGGMPGQGMPDLAQPSLASQIGMQRMYGAMPGIGAPPSMHPGGDITEGTGQLAGIQNALTRGNAPEQAARARVLQAILAGLSPTMQQPLPGPAGGMMPRPMPPQGGIG